MADVDAGVIDAPVDAPSQDSGPEQATFPVGSTDCDNSRCKGGYNGQKDASGPPTADKLCTDHAFARSASYTISNNQPGGRFCSWNVATMQFQCDGSCSGCNAIDNVTCTKP